MRLVHDDTGSSRTATVPYGENGMFQQTFTAADLPVIGLLIILEGVLSIDNALVLGLLARRLPKHQQKRALTYGLVGAFVFRIAAITFATYLLHYRVTKLVGGGYLCYVALKYLILDPWFKKDEKPEPAVTADKEGMPRLVDDQGRPVTGQQAEDAIAQRAPVDVAASANQGGTAKFWPTVFVIEMTDIAFAMDSILAAIALVGPAPPNHTGTHPKLWVIITGGILGVVLMRFAAVLFIRLLESFPRFETAAYLLVLIIGGKLVVDWYFNTEEHPHAVNFHSLSDPAFWIFWGLMGLAFCVGFLPGKKKDLSAVAEVH